MTSDHPLDSSRSSDHGDSSRSEMAASDPSEQSKPGEEEAGDERLSAPVQSDSSPAESWAESDEGEVEGVGSFDHASKVRAEVCGLLPSCWASVGRRGAYWCVAFFARHYRGRGRDGSGLEVIDGLW